MDIIIRASQKRFLHYLSVVLMSLAFIFGDGVLCVTFAQAIDDPAPEFETYSIEGRYFSSESLEGEQTLLMFWAPWCGVCRRELPKLAQYYRETGSAEIQILTIGTASPESQVKGYVEDHSNTFVFPTVYDDGRLLKDAFGIRAFPTYVLLDEEGTIRLIHRGSGVLNNSRFQSLVE